MNRMLLNGSSLNGAVRGLVLATAAVVCATSVGATAIRVTQATGLVAGSASCTSQVTYVHSAKAATVLSEGQTFPSATHTQAGKIDLLGSAHMVAYVLRAIPSHATLQAGVQIIAVVASTQGQGSLVGAATVAASGTRVQAARSSAPAEAAVTWSAQPVLTRLPYADLLCQVAVRGEPTVNGVSLSYVDNLASAEVVASALCTRIAQGEFEGQAEVFAPAVLQQPGQAEALTSGVLLLIEPHIEATLQARLDNEAVIVATAVIGKLAASGSTGTASVQTNALQRHAGGMATHGGVTLQATSQVTSKLFADVYAQVVTSADALRYVLGEAEVTGECVVEIDPVTKIQASANYLGQGEVTAFAEDLNTRHVQSDAVFFGTVITEANPSLFVVAFVNFAGSFQMLPLAQDLNDQRVLARSTVVSSADILVTSVIKHAGIASAYASIQLTSQAEYLNARRIPAGAEVLGFTDVVVESLRTLNGAVNLSGTSQGTCQADTTVRQASATGASSAGVVAQASIVRYATSSVDCTGQVLAFGHRLLLGGSLGLIGSATIYADTIANPEAIDPEYRTFVRTADVVAFVRPAIETEFKRAA